MKVECNKEFVPVTLTLETKEEYETLMKVCGYNVTIASAVAKDSGPYVNPQLARTLLASVYTKLKSVK